MTLQEKIKILTSKNTMNAAFIQQAIYDYAVRVLANEEQIKTDLAGGFIPAEIWIQCAKDCKEMVDS